MRGDAYTRRNALGRASRVRDCFSESYGYPVLNGTRSSLCLDRRITTYTGEYQAYVDVSTLKKNLEPFIEATI